MVNQKGEVMAKYELTSPDGQKYEVEAPEDATEQQVMQYFQGQLEAQPQKPSMKKMVSNALDMAYRATPLGLIQTAQEKGSDLVQQGADFAADKTIDATNSPALATAVKMSPAIANLVVGNRIAAMPQKFAPNNEAARAAQRIGYRPDLAQRTDQRDLKNLADTLRNMPGGAGVYQKLDSANQEAINAAAASGIGQKAKAITGEVLANATDELGATRNQLKDMVNIPKGDQGVLSALDDASSELKKSLGSTGRFKSDVERIKQGINAGSINGEQYQIWRTDLRDARDTAYKAGKTKLGDAYRRILTALDDSARQSSSELWKENDKAFATLNMLQDGNIVNPVTGDVSQSLLTNKFYREYGKNAKQGKMPGPVADIATVTKGYKPPVEGSQTARREAYSSLFPWMLSPLSYGAAKLMTADPYTLLRYGAYGPTLQSLSVGLLGDYLQQTP
jgi:hypothetical protein